jgi:hypothetical protein
MTQGERDNEERRAVEALAQALYEEHDPAGLSWARRTRIVRDPWLLRARRQLSAAKPSPATSD